MEAETNSPEDASAMSVPLVKSSTNIGSEEIKFLQKIGNDVNSKYPLVEEKEKEDSNKTSEGSETRPQEIYQESCKVSVESEEQTKHQPEGYSIEKKILRYTDLEGPVMTESIPKSSEHEDESMSTLPELAINQGEMAEKSFVKETYKEEESTALDNDQSYKPQNELEQMSKALEAIDVAKFMGKDTADNEHADHQSNLEGETTEINPTNDTKEQEKVPVSHTGEELENEDDGKFKQEKAKETEEATEMQLLKTATDSLPEEEVQTKLPTPAFVQGDTDPISQQQTLHDDESEAINNATVVEEPEQPETKDNIGIVKEQADRQSEESSVSSVITNYKTAEGHVTSESSTKLTDDVDVNEQKTVDSRLVENLENQGASEITAEEATDAKQSTDVEITQSEIEGVPKDKALQTIAKAGSVRNEAVDESSQEERQPEAEFTEKFNKEVQTPQYDTEETAEINTTNDTEKQEEVPASHTNEKQGIEDGCKFDQEEAKEIEEATKMQLTEEEFQTLPTPAFVQGDDTDQISQQQSLHNDESEAIDNGKKSCIPEIEHDGKYTVVEEPELPETKDNVGIVKEEQTDHQTEESSQQSVNTNYITAEGHVTSQSSTKLSDDIDYDEQTTVESRWVDNLENKDASEITAKEDTDAKQSTDVHIPKSETEASVGNEAVDESSQKERQPEAEVTEKFNKDEQTTQYDTEETAKINTTNDTEEQKVPASHAKEKLGIEDDGKFDQEEARGTEESTKTQLPKEEVQTTLPTPAFVQGDTDQISQPQTLHDDESEAIDNAKSCIPEIEHDGKSTFVEEPEQPETKDNIGIVKEEQANHQSEDLSVQSVITNYIAAEGHVTAESSTKLSDDVIIDEQKTVESHSVENLENQDASEITAEEATDAKQSTDVEITQLETEGVPEDIALQTILDEASVGNEADDESSKEERQPEVEFTEKFNEEVQTPQNDTEETAEINTTNDTVKQKEIPASHAKEKLGIEDDGKFDQEPEGIEEATKTQLPEEEVQRTLPNAAFVQGDTDQIPRQQTLHNDESEVIDIAKNICTPEIELGGKSTVVEEYDQPEAKDNISIEKEEQADHQSEQSSVSSVITNYTTAEGHVTSESSTKLTYDIDVDEQKIVHAHSVENLENKDASEITAVQATDAKQSTDVKIPKSETKGVPEDKALQPILDEASVENKAVDESSQEERQPEADITEKFNEEVQTPQYDPEETAEINTTNDTEKQEEVPASHTKEELGIEDGGKFDQAEAKEIEEATKTQLPEEQVQTTLPTPAFVQGDTDQILQQQTQHDDESEVIDIAKNISTLEIELDVKSTVVEEPEKPETKGNAGIVKEQPDHQSEESSVPRVITNYTTAEGQVTSESSAKSTDDINVDEQKTLDSSTAENFENKDASEITAKQATDAKQLTDVDIQKSETEGVPEDKALQPILDEASVENEAVDESSQEERQPEAEITEKLNEEEQTPQYDTEETAEINTTNDTEKQEEVPASDAKEELGIEDGGKFNQAEAKEIEEATKTQLPEEQVQTTLPTPAFVQADTDQLPQQQTQHGDESEAIDIDKNISTPEIELDGKSTVVEEREQLETKDNVDIVKEEADHQSEESSVPSVITNYTTTEGHITSESSPKLTDDVDIDEQKTVESRLVENLENKNISEITREQVTDAKQLTDEEITKSESKGVPHDKALQTILDEASEGNEEVDQSSQETRQPEAKFTEKFNEEVQTPDYDTEETADINTTNDTEKQEEVPISHAKEKLGIEDDGKFVQEEAKGIEEATIKQLPKEEVQTTLPTPAFVQGDTDQIPQQQTLQVDESEAINIAKNICTPEIELDGKSTVVEEPKHPETNNNISIVKEEQPDHQSEESTDPSVITNYTTAEGHITPESSTKFTDSRSVENLENKDASEITAEQATESKQSTDMEIQKSETEVVPEDKALQPILDEASVENKAVDESSQERQPEEEITQKFNEEVQTPQYDTEETAEINTTNDTEKQEEVPGSHTQEEIGIEDGGKFDQEAKEIEEATKTHLREEQVQTTLPTAAFVQGDTDQIPQQQTQHEDESEAIDIAKNISTPEIELDGKSTVVEEREQPETKHNVGILKEQQDHQSEESSVPSVITNFTTEEGQVTSESSAKLTDDVNIDEQKTVDSSTIENFENKDASEITAEQATDAKQSNDVDIQKSETEGEPEDKALKPILDEESDENKAVDESSKEERQPEAEITEKLNEEEQTPQFDTEETAEINTTNDTEKQEEVPASDAKEELGIEDGGKFDQEEAKEIEEEQKTQLPEEQDQTTLPPPALVQADTDQLPQQQTQHDDESEAIDIAKNISTPEIELDGKSTVIEEPEQPETKGNIGKVKQEQADHQSEETSESSVITNYRTVEGQVTTESSAKLTDDVDVNEHKAVDSGSVENFEKDVIEITAELVTDDKQSTDVEIPESKTEGVPEDKALQPILDKASIENKAVDESSQEERQPEAEITEKLKEEEQTPQFDTQETAEINTTNDTEKQEEVPASHAKEELGIEDGGKFGQDEAKEIEEATNMQLPEEQVQTTLPPPAFVQADTYQLQQQQTQHDDESEAIDIAKNISTPEIELDGKSTVVEEPEQPETKGNIGIVKEEPADHQSEESSVSSVITNYRTTEGQVTSESSAKLTDDVDVDEQKTVDSRSVENLEKDVIEITAEQVTDDKQSTDVEIPKSETEGVPQDKALQPILDRASIENKAVVESSQEERQPEAEITEKLKEEEQTPQFDTQETAEINTTNDTEKQEELPASHAKEELGIEDGGKFGQEEATNTQLPEEQVQTTLPTPAFVQADTYQLLQQQTQHDDESEVIDIAKNISTPEIELDGKSTVVEEPEQPETKGNIGKVKQEQADHQSEETSESSVITNYRTVEGQVTSESSAKLTDDVDVNQHKAVDSGSVENLEKDVIEITAEQLTDDKQSTAVEIPKSETEGVPEDKALQPILDKASVENKAVDESSQEERQPEAEITEKLKEEEQTPQFETQETAEINTTNDTEKQEEVPASHAKGELGIEDGGKFDQEEAKEIEEATKTQLPEEQVQTTLPTPAFVDTYQLPQQQNKHDDESEAIDIAKNISTPEIQLDGKSTVVEEPEQPQTMGNIGIVKEEQPDHQSEESSVSTVITNYRTAEGQVTSEGSAKLSDDVDINKQKTVDSRSVENLEKDVIEITAEQVTDDKQSTDVEIPKSETKGVPEDKALQPILDKTSVEYKAVDESSQEERQPEAEITEKLNEEEQTPQYDTEETAEINTTNDTEKQEEVPASHAKEELGIEDGGKFDQEEAKEIEEATKTQLPEEQVQTTLPTPAFVQADTDQLPQQQNKHDDESEAIDIAKNISTPEIELNGKSTVVEEPEQPETMGKISIVKEEQADHQSEESSVLSVITNYRTAEGQVTSESSAKLTDDVDINEKKTVDSRSVENLEKDVIEITAEQVTEDKQSTEVEIPKSETEADVPEDRALQPILDEASVENKAVDKSSQEERQPEAEITDKLNEEEQTPQFDTEETAEINTTNDTGKQEEVPASHAKEELGIEDGGKFGQEEAKEIEEATNTQLPEEQVQTTLPPPAFVQADTYQLPQQQTQHDDESEAIDIAKNISTPEIELDGKSTVVEEPEQPETMGNISIVKEEQADHQSEESSVLSVITNYRTAEGQVTSESSAKLTDDVDINEQKTVDSRSVENLEKDVIEITAEQVTEDKQSTEVEIPKSETEGLPEDKALQPILDEASVENKAVDESSQEERQPEAEITEKLNEEEQTPQYDTEETAEINTTNDTEKEEEVPASHAKEELGIEDGSKFDQEEAKEIEEATKTQSPEEQVQTTFPTPAFVQADTDQLPQQQTQHDDESEAIDIANNISTPEIELDGKSTIVEERELPETKDNVGIVKEQAYNLSKESSVLSVITYYTTVEGHVTSESSTKLTDDVNVNEQQTVDSSTVENFENKDASEITAEQATDAKQSTNVEIPKSETEGMHEDKALQTILDKASDGNEAVDQCSQEARQPEAKFTEKLNEDVQTPQYDTETAEINTTNDTEKQEEVPASHAKEKLVIEDDGKFDQEEAKGIEEATKMQLLEEEVQTTLPTLACVQGDIDQISRQQTLNDDESEAIDNAKKSCIPEIELDRKSTVIEEPEQPETKANAGIVKKEQADHQSEESSAENVITNITAGHVTSESSTKLNDDVDVNEQKTVESRSVEILEYKDASKIRAEGTDSKQLTDLEIQKSETEGVLPEDKALQTIPNAASIRNDASDECSKEEIQPQEEYAVTHTKEVQTPHYEFDVQKDISEEDTCQLSAENEQKLKSQPAPPNEETTFINHPYSDGEMAEINPTNDIEEEENPTSYTNEKLAIEDDSKLNQEEAKEATKTQLLNTATESPPEKEVQPKLPAPATVQGDTDQNLQQQTLHDDESVAIDNAKRCIPENELDRMSTVVEEPDQPETKANGIVKEEQSDNQSQGSSMQSVITNYITAEGHLASESSTKSSYDVNEQKTVDSQLVENLENKDASKITTEEATNAKQLTDVEIQKLETDGVPENKAMQTLPNTASVGNESVDDSKQEEIQLEAEFAVTFTKEMQTPQYEFDAKNDIPEAYGEKEDTYHLNAENKQKSESQPASQNEGTTFINHPYQDGETAEMNPTNGIEEEEIPTSYSKEKLVIEDDGKFDQDEAKGIKEATKTLLLNTATDSLTEEEVQEILPTRAIVQGDTKQIIQQKTLHNDESEAIDNAKSCIPENELDRMFIVVEEPDQPETKANVGIVKEEQADNQSQGSNMQSVITNYITAEGHLASESSTKLSYDMNEQKTVDSQLVENLEIKDASKITAEEATDAKQLTDVEIQKSETEDVPEDKALQTLINAASVGNETVDVSHQKEIQPEEEFAVTYTKEVQTPQYEFDAKKDIPEDPAKIFVCETSSSSDTVFVETAKWGVQEETCQLTAENEQKSESQPAVQNEETTFIKHPYSDGETAEINPTNDTEEQEDFPVSLAKEKLGIEDNGKFDQEEAKGIEQATKTQLLNTATESLPDEEVQPNLPTPAIVQGDPDQILQQQTLHSDESEAIDNAKSCIPENELERMSIVVEDTDQPEALANISTVKEEQADHQSEASSMQSAISNYINAEGRLTSESSAKLCYNVDEQKTVDSDSVDNLESKDASKITSEKATDAKQLTDVEIQKSETESVSEDKAMQTLPSTASVSIEVDKNIQEIHTEAELAVTDTKEGQISEDESEAKKEASEYMLKTAFDLHKVACQTSAENEQKADFLSEEQSQETTDTKHPNLEGEAIEINPTNETEEHEKVPASYTGELEINDDGNFIQEEEKEMEKATERQLLKTATESVPEDEVQTTLPTSTIVKGETVEGVVQEQTLEEEESAAIDNNSGRPENELEQMANVVETIDHETMAKVSAEDEEHANHNSEQSIMENVITKHINSERMVATENSTKSSYDVEELEKVLEQKSIENSEIKDCRKILPEEASDMKEATDVPEDNAISTLPTIPSVKVEIVEESIQEVIQNEAEPAVTDTKEEQRPENDFVKNMEVLEAFDLHKAPGNTPLENEKKAEVQCEAKSREIIIKHPNLEGLETAEISPSNDTKELEKEHEVTTGVSESVSTDITEQTDTGKPETQETETAQLGSTKEDEAGDEFEKISPPSSVSVISRESQDTDTKVSHKKSHGILSGVGSKVKHSISKVKKAITGKSSHPKTPPSSK